MRSGRQQQADVLDIYNKMQPSSGKSKNLLYLSSGFKSDDDMVTKLCLESLTNIKF